MPRSLVAALLAATLLSAPIACTSAKGTPTTREARQSGAAAAPTPRAAARRSGFPARPEALRLPELRAFTPPQPTRLQLANGLTVLLLEDHDLPLVHLAATLRAGSVWEPADKLGLAALTGEVMQSGGTSTLPGDQLDEELDRRAISLSLAIGESSASAGVSSLAETFDRALAIFSDLLRRPAFPEDKLALAKAHAKTEIARRNDDADGIAAREFAKLVYGADSPWARTTEIATLDRIARADLVAFHAAAFHPDRMVLGVTGDFRSADLLARLETAFADWKPAGGSAPTAPEATAEAPGSSGVHLVKKPDVNQSSIVVGHLGVRRDHPDYAALVLLDNVLGSGGFSSRLFTHVREQRGLAYDIHSSLGAGFDHRGTFQVGSQTKSATTAAVIRAILDEIKTIRETPIAAAELAQARESFLNSSVFYYDDKSEVLARHLRYEYFHLPHDFLEQLLSQVKAVTIADVQRVARTWLRPEALTILVVGNDAEFGAPLSDLGPVVEVPLVTPKATAPPAAPAPAGDTAPPATADAAAPASTSAPLPTDTPAARAQGAALAGAAIEVHGGYPALSGVKDMRFKSQMVVVTPQGEIPFGCNLSVRLPDKIRMLIQSPMGPITQVFDGAHGWVTTPQGTKEMDGSDTAEMKRTIESQWILLLVAIADGKLPALYAGACEIAGKPAEELVLLPAGAALAGAPRLAFDKATHRLLRQTESENGATQHRFYDDFRPVGAVLLPYRWTTYVDGAKQMDMRLTDARLNAGIEDKEFARPAGKTKKPAAAPPAGAGAGVKPDAK
ncbi:MAG: insulinase family protein [Planctomycetes bacterium]|nr:insulinase family protein [Planctomycetota bacterium]